MKAPRRAGAAGCGGVPGSHAQAASFIASATRSRSESCRAGRSSGTWSARARFPCDRSFQAPTGASGEPDRNADTEPEGGRLVDPRESDPGSTQLRRRLRPVDRGGAEGNRSSRARPCPKPVPGAWEAGDSTAAWRVSVVLEHVDRLPSSRPSRGQSATRPDAASLFQAGAESRAIMQWLGPAPLPTRGSPMRRRRSTTNARRASGIGEAVERA